jgi:isocitrate dehydrogenase
MKLTDGLFLESFYEVAKDYPEIQANDIIVDDLAMKLVSRPNDFDILVLPNLQGDILSDLCAGLVGGLGFAPSANIGDNVSIFEAVHGSAPDIAGKNIANPTALLISSCMMLRHLGFQQEANAIEQALHTTLNQGFHTKDFGSGKDQELNTTQFAEMLISNLTTLPAENILQDASVERPSLPNEFKMMTTPYSGETFVNGVDLFIESTEQPSVIAHRIKDKLADSMELIMISNRGTQVYPQGSLLTECVNQYRVRVERVPGNPSLTSDEILQFCLRLAPSIKLCSIEWLMMYNGQRAYSLAQGQ